MVEFTVMNVNFRLNEQQQQQGFGGGNSDDFTTEILQTKPDVIFIQGSKSQQQINSIDTILQENGTFYSYYCRQTKYGLSSVMVKTSNFRFELVKRDRFNVGTPENRRCLFNGLTCVKLTHVETKAVIFVGSWHSDENAFKLNQKDDALTLTKSMGVISQNGLWLVGGSFSDQSNNAENRFLIGINKSKKCRLGINNICASQCWGVRNFPITANISMSVLS